MASTASAFESMSFKRLPNGPKSALLGGVFSQGEIESRLQKLRKVMAAKNLDACLLTSIHNINYYSGFLYCSFGRPYGLVVTQDDSTTISANIDFGQPFRRSFDKNLVFTDWKKNNYWRAVRSLLEEPLKQAGTSGKSLRLGFETDHMTVEKMHTLQEFIPEATHEESLVDVAGDTMRLRMLKSAEEIALITQGARVADVGGAACVDALKAHGSGVPEYEVALNATQAMVREIARTYPEVELMDTWTWFQSGINTDGAHNPVTTRKVQHGDILSLNTFPMIAGYYTALERTLFMGAVSDAHLRIWEVNCEVHRRGLELIKPGARCCDIAKELNEIYAKHGLLDHRTFGYGHSFGTLSHYYGREAGLELREDVETVLQPNHVVSMEPMLTLPEGHEAAGGYREHDILVVTEDGSRNITGFPFGPEHNVIS